ncbi:MAG: hybrid sensor histidine kinase/response regulator [Bacillota bacterium]
MFKNADFIKDFVEEAASHAEAVEEGLLKLEKGEGSADIIHGIFRNVHSIKGAAGFFGMHNIVELSHVMESLFGEIRNGNLLLGSEMLEILLSSNDFLKAMIADIENSEQKDISPYIAQLSTFLDISAPTGLEQETQYEADQEITSIIPEVLHHHSVPLNEQAQYKQEYYMIKQENEVSGMDGTKKRLKTADQSIRVQVNLLNDLLNLASEMVLGRNQLLRILDRYRKEIPGLGTVLQNIDHITTELQQKVIQTRMQPLAKIFDKFPRIIRELAHKMGKEILLQMDGADVELDKSMIENLGDPITHLIRNAADHGIEKQDVRELKGKSRTGTINIKAYHEGGHVNIDVVDDGRGIDIEDVKDKVLQKGLISPTEIPLLGEREVLEFLCHPGFSTAEKVTDLSGRGVGMDVVKTNIEKLGGTMEIMTTPGWGTTIRLTLPLTLAIISSLIVEVGEQKFALPQVNLQGMVRIKATERDHWIKCLHEAEVLRYRGMLLPIVHLSDVISIQNKISTTGNAPESNTLSDIETKDEIIRVLIIKNGSKRYGLVVDQIHDGEEILVKPVPRYLRTCQCYSGVTILGDGRIAMILDPEGISGKSGLRFGDESRESNALDTEYPSRDLIEKQDLLLFKCSGPETFALDLSIVARVENIRTEQIEKIGNLEFIQLRGEALRIIRPENYLPVNIGEKDSQKLYVIIPKLVKSPMGILIEQIVDTMESRVEFNHDDILAKGIVGSAILDHRIVLLINIYELFDLVIEGHHLTEEDNTAGSIKFNVLLVEDTPFFLKAEKQYLESAGYHVITARNGQEAWDLLQAHTVDVVVSDIEMPVMDGLELINRVRADNKLFALPAIALTSKGDELSIIKGLESGFNFYEIKLDKERLLEKVNLAIQKKG